MSLQTLLNYILGPCAGNRIYAVYYDRPGDLLKAPASEFATHIDRKRADCLWASIRIYNAIKYEQV